jgi:hypothetical protein
MEMRVNRITDIGVRVVLSEEEARWLMRLIQNDLSGAETIEDADMRFALWNELHHAEISVL